MNGSIMVKSNNRSDRELCIHLAIPKVSIPIFSGQPDEI